jgi:biotin carboxyl carrier protein
MKVEVRIGTAARQFEIQRVGTNQFVATGRDGAQIDAVQVAPHIYSLLVDGRVFEATALAERDGVLIQCGGEEFHALVSDPRAWRGARGALFGAEGKQQVTAPMPGKVVRILVSAGEEIEAHQGLVVVEAMKMQNEIRASRSGTIERVFVREGQAVAAGEALVTIS